MAAGAFEAVKAGDAIVVKASGAWTIDAVARLDEALSHFSATGVRSVRFDLSGLEALDTAGAWLISRTQTELAAAGIEASIAGLKPAHETLFKRVVEAGTPPKLPALPHYQFLDVIARLGRGTMTALLQARDLLNFFGAVLFALARVIRHPSRIRLISFISHLEQGGLNAVPIVGLINFLVGIVIAFQGADQLRKFGAEVLTVDTVGVLVLREMAILLTAILVAGRSGSAYTAQIGMMKVNEEVDALRTLGLDPLEVLVLPRIFALVVALPLLTFFADITAIVGAALISTVIIDLSVSQFFGQLKNAVGLTELWVGLSKAPIFAFVIAMVGCFEGLRVSGSAESVGRQTTQSVVESIFLVIVLDAMFSVLFSVLKI